MKRVTPETMARTYTVRAYDTLAAIARKTTGSADYSAIYEQNKDLIGDNPNNLVAGMVLTIPGDVAPEDDW